MEIVYKTKKKHDNLNIKSLQKLIHNDKKKIIKIKNFLKKKEFCFRI